MNILIALLTIVAFLPSQEERNWTLRVVEDGISVYTRKAATTDILECQAVATLDRVSLAEVLDVILDVEGYPSLFPDCIASETLFRDGKYHDIHYYAMKAPWPVKDRDAIYESVTTLAPDGRNAKVVLWSVPDYRPEKKDFIRIRKGEATWELSEFQDSTVRVTYWFLADPGGGIPVWLINSAMVSNPLKTMINLRKKTSGQLNPSNRKKGE